MQPNDIEMHIGGRGELLLVIVVLRSWRDAAMKGRLVLPMVLWVVCLWLMTACTMPSRVDGGRCLETGIAFFRVLAQPDRQKEAVMGMADYSVYGYPALLFSTGYGWGVRQPSRDQCEVSIPFWVDGVLPNGEAVKLSRGLLVELKPNAASPTDWSVSRFKFRNEKPLALWWQLMIWVPSVTLAPFLFFLILYLPFRGEARGVAIIVANMMSAPIQGYVTFLCFGSVSRAAFVLFVWHGLMVLRQDIKLSAQAAGK